MKTKYFGIASAFFCLSLLSYSFTQAKSAQEFSPKQLVTLANSDRAKNKIPSLSENSQLDLAAQLKLSDIDTNKYFDHTSPQGLTPWYFIKKADYNYESAGENLALNFSDLKSVESAWMNSAEHKKNILNPQFTEIGIAEKEIIYRGQKTNVIVEILGNRSQLAQR